MTRSVHDPLYAAARAALMADDRTASRLAGSDLDGRPWQIWNTGGNVGAVGREITSAESVYLTVDGDGDHEPEHWVLTHDMGDSETSWHLSAEIHPAEGDMVDAVAAVLRYIVGEAGSDQYPHEYVSRVVDAATNEDLTAGMIACRVEVTA